MLQQVFTNIYKSNGWHCTETVSGGGSRVCATVRLRKQLPCLFLRLGVHSILDAPCGDFNWMQHVSMPGIQYTGMDIVEEMIASNNAKYGNDSRNFICGNLAEIIPPCSDLIICRDCLQHLCFDNGVRVLNNFKASGSKYLLTTTYIEHTNTFDILDGDTRYGNLSLYPYGLGPAMEYLEDKSAAEVGHPDNRMGLWKLN